MIYFISYDITDSKRRREVSKILENFGIRIQYSFFQCEMDQSQLEKLKNEILKIIHKREDSLRIYPLCQDCNKKVVLCGNGEIYIPQSFYIL